MGRKKSKEVKAPNKFVRHLESEALRSLVQQVWERIPAAERGIIDVRLSGIYPAELARRGEGPIFQQPVAGIEAVQRVITCNIELGDVLVHMWVDEARLEKMTDEVAVAVIVHEFAHVFLAHECYQKTFEYLGAFEPLRVAAIKAVHEWDADLHAWLWGFREELKIRAIEHGRKKPPWFLTPQCGQPQTQKGPQGRPGDKGERGGG